jgi:O-antigen ligase/Flp pilus assembly protein TadD
MGNGTLVGQAPEDESKREPSHQHGGAEIVTVTYAAGESSEVGPGRRVGWAALLGAAALAYTIGIGGTAVGELFPPIFVLNAALTACLVAIYIRGAYSADRVDRLVLIALLVMLASCILSTIPRRSFDSGLLILAYAAAFFVARGLFARKRNRVWIVRVLRVLSLAMTLGVTLLWGAIAIRWMAIAGPGILPPLNLELPGVIWGHRHDLALVTAMLYPAWWIGETSRTRRMVASLIGLLVLFAVVIDGSRTLWIAFAVATLVLVTGPALRGWRRSSQMRTAMIVGAGGIVVFLVLSGLGLALLSRATSTYSFGFRTTMWSSLIDAWLAHPIAGSGPGTFPWILQGVGYFDANSLAPRHPDSAPIQLLAESGLLGVAALGVLLLALMPSIGFGRSRGATWALVSFAVASLAGNPSDFPFVVAVVIVWAAYATPRSLATTVGMQRNHRGVSVASFTAAAFIGAAYLLTVVAAVSYERGREQIGRADVAQAGLSLDMAMRLDPGMAIYSRARGLVAFISGDAAGAVGHFRHATQLNPHDPVAWRSLAAAHREMGDDVAAEAALAEALRLMRADSTSLLMWAEWQADDGHEDEAVNTLAQAVHAWPQITAAEGWATLLERSGATGSAVVDLATKRWEDNLPMPETLGDQGIWLAVLSGRDDLFSRAFFESGFDPALWEPTVASLRCEAISAELASASASTKRTPAYWALRLRNSSLTDTADPNMMWMLNTANGTPLVDPQLRRSPFTGVPNDLWGYRRYPVVPEEPLPTIPSPESGVTRWYLDPEASGATAGVAGCGS